MGRQVLYSAGKKFGFVYAKTSNYPTKEIADKKELENFLNLFLSYTAATFAHKIDHKTNLNDGVYKMYMDGYLVCSKNGKDLVLSEGGPAGVWSYIMENPRMEAIQMRCQGRGDAQCMVICGPSEKLVRLSNDILYETDLPEIKLTSEYKRVNLIRKTSYAKLSLKNLLDSKFFTHKEGFVQRKSIRYALCESSLVYLLEKEILEKLDDEQILFDISKRFGEIVAKTEDHSKPFNFVMDYMSSLGWGDVLAVDDTKIRIISNFFPWSQFSKDSHYVIFRGIISGLLTEFLSRDINLAVFRTNVTSDGMSLVVDEE